MIERKIKSNLFVRSVLNRVVLLFLLTLIACKNDRVTVSRLSCEYQENPLGVETAHPRFSWIIESDQRGTFQQSYEIIVSDDSDKISKKEGNIWNSGQIKTNRTINIPYEGGQLKSNTNYYWRVGITTNRNEKCWSKPVYFHTGLLDSSDWKAEWITAKAEIVHASPFFRKEFSVKKKIKSAYAYATAGGYYELYLNGVKVGDHVMDPAITDFHKRILYSTYDVTDYLKTGNNAAGVIIGNGAYNYRPSPGRYGLGDIRANQPRFIVQMNISFDDGSQEIVVSDGSWKSTNGPITYNNFYGGEDYDATKEIVGWNLVSYNDADWAETVSVTKPEGKLVAQSSPPIRVTGSITPIASVKEKDGVYLFDLGQNIAGWWQLHVTGNAGQIIRVRGAETLNDALFPKKLEQGDRLSEKFRYHSQTWTDYTLKGDKEEVYEPRFFYTGFRYIEVATNDHSDLKQLNVVGRVVGSDIERNGSFSSSDSLLNQIHRAGLWSQRSNLVGNPTDCPHREKGAYAGDGQVIAETSMHDFQMASFYTKWMNDMRDAQEENGRIPNTCPTLVGGMGGGIAWGSAYILIPYWMSNYYNDTRILEEHYSGMKRYVRYLSQLAKTDDDPKEPYIIDNFYGYWYSLGEWCAPGQSDCPNHPVVNTFYYYYDAKILSEIAKILGKEDDEKQFNSLSDTIKTEFNRKFFNASTCNYGADSTYQTYQLLALWGDMVPKEYRGKVLATVVDDIQNRNMHLNTGIIGTKYLWPVLVENGYSDLAFELATQKSYPGYGYWLENNSTTLLEFWEGKESHNHQMFGSIVEYFYKYLAGIQLPMDGQTSAGYQQIYLKPCLPEKLNSVNATLETMSGRIVSSWKKENQRLLYKVSVPANTRAVVVLPVNADKLFKLKEGGTLIWDGKTYIDGVDGITSVEKEGAEVHVKIESGNYQFELMDEIMQL